MTEPGKVYGAVIGQVAALGDSSHIGQAAVTFAALGKNYQNWAPVAAPMAGDDRGCWLMPEVGDEAVIVFEQGDVSYPIIIGFLWNGVDHPPSTAVRERVIRSVNGHTIRLIDSTPTPGGTKGAIVVEDAHGNQIVLTDGKVTVLSHGVLELKGAAILLTSAGVSRVVSPTGNPI
ncbi:phage baseplate assembly protein V [Arthrobacter humicola]